MKDFEFEENIDKLFNEYKNEKIIKNYLLKRELIKKDDYKNNINKYQKIFKENNLGSYINHNDINKFFLNLKINKDNNLKKRYLKEFNNGQQEWKKIKEKYLNYDLLKIDNMIYQVESQLYNYYIFIELDDCYKVIGLLRSEYTFSLSYLPRYATYIYLLNQIEKGNIKKKEEIVEEIEDEIILSNDEKNILDTLLESWAIELYKENSYLYKIPDERIRQKRKEFIEMLKK